MKILLTIIMFMLICSMSIAGEFSGGAGLEAFKVENGPSMFSPFMKGDLTLDAHFKLKGSFYEGFSVIRGGVVPNHHHFRYTLGAKWTPLKHITVGYWWDNRWLIPGHDNIFVEEFSGNRNYLNVYYKW